MKSCSSFFSESYLTFIRKVAVHFDAPKASVLTLIIADGREELVNPAAAVAAAPAAVACY